MEKVLVYEDGVGGTVIYTEWGRAETYEGERNVPGWVCKLKVNDESAGRGMDEKD